MSDPVKPKPPEPIQVQEGRVCANCVWWRIEPSYEWRGGDCRKREPVVGAVILTTENCSEKPKEGTWPLTKKDDWCGAFGSKQPAFITETVKEAPVVTP